MRVIERLNRLDERAGLVSPPRPWTPADGPLVPVDELHPPRWPVVASVAVTTSGVDEARERYDVLGEREQGRVLLVPRPAVQRGRLVCSGRRRRRTPVDWARGPEPHRDP